MTKPKISEIILTRQVITILDKVFRWLVVFVVTLIVSVAGSLPVFVTGLVVREVVSRPLTLLVMGLLAALTSSWGSNLLSGNSTYSRILRIVATTETAAILLIFLPMQFAPNMALLAVWGVILSVIAYLAAWKFRNSEYNRRQDIIISLFLLALAPTTVVITIVIASRFGLTGA